MHLNNASLHAFHIQHQTALVHPPSRLKSNMEETATGRRSECIQQYFLYSCQKCAEEEEEEATDLGIKKKKGLQ
jgi:hypothetical protein